MEIVLQDQSFNQDMFFLLTLLYLILLSLKKLVMILSLRKVIKQSL